MIGRYILKNIYKLINGNKMTEQEKNEFYEGMSDRHEQALKLSQSTREEMIEYVKGFYTKADEDGRSLFDFMQDGGLLQEFIDLYTDLNHEDMLRCQFALKYRDKGYIISTSDMFRRSVRNINLGRDDKDSFPIDVRESYCNDIEYVNKVKQKLSHLDADMVNEFFDIMAMTVSTRSRDRELCLKLGKIVDEYLENKKNGIKNE